MCKAYPFEDTNDFVENDTAMPKSGHSPHKTFTTQIVYKIVLQQKSCICNRDFNQNAIPNLGKSSSQATVECVCTTGVHSCGSSFGELFLFSEYNLYRVKRSLMCFPNGCTLVYTGTQLIVGQVHCLAG